MGWGHTTVIDKRLSPFGALPAANDNFFTRECCGVDEELLKLLPYRHRQIAGLFERTQRLMPGWSRNNPVVGGTITVRVSVSALPLPPLVEVTLLVVFTLVPAVVPVTLAVTVQVPLAATMAPEKVSDVLPPAGA